MIKRIVCLSLVVLFGLTAFSFAATIIVKADGSGDYPTIQAAIDDANEGDIIEVWPGIYTGPGNRDIDPNGKNLTIRNTNPNDPNIVAATIIDCNGRLLDGHRGFYFHSGEDNNSVLDGLTITNGFAPLDLNVFLEDGGGILIVNSSPIIRNCIITNNEARFGGGMGVHGGFGGGICCYDNANALITNCNLTSNTSNNAGAGIACCSSSNPTISNCIFSSNSSFHGGGIGCDDNSNPFIINCTVVQNHTLIDGAGIYCFNSHPTVLNCTISGNTAGDWFLLNGLGGGIASFDSNQTIRNCVIVGNYAGVRGGGTYCGTVMNPNPSNPSIINCTIAHNYAGDSGGGIACNYTNANLTNSVLWGNTAASPGPQIALFLNPLWPSTLTVSYCDIQGGQTDTYVANGCSLNWLTGNIDKDPCFVEPGYWDPNGTPDDANDDFWVNGDYHLKSEGWRWDTDTNGWTWDSVTSRCIDAGNPGSPLGEEPLTVPDDPNNIWGENLRINMGAFGGTNKASMPPYDWAILGDLTNDGTVDFADLAHWAENWLSTGDEWPGDLDGSGIIDIVDFALLAQDWFAETSWYEP